MINDPALVVASTAVKNAITHFQLHSGARGAAGTLLAVGTRQPTGAGVVDADGDIMWSNIAFTGLAANQAVAEVSYWSAVTAGTYYGGAVLTGDATANAAGEYSVTSVTENTSIPT